MLVDNSAITNAANDVMALGALLIIMFLLGVGAGYSWREMIGRRRRRYLAGPAPAACPWWSTIS